MLIKLQSLTFSKRFPFWVCSNACFSALSCTKTIEIFSGNNQDPENSSDFEQNIQSLRNQLVPDNLIRVLDNTDDLSSAVKVFKWASLQKRFNHTADTYFRIVLKLGLAGNVEEMEGFCQNMVKDRCPGVEEALLALIDVFVRHCRLSEAMRVLVNFKAGGFRPSIETFNSVLGALVKDKRDFRDFLFVYKEIVTAGIVPSIDTLNYLLEALLESGRIESAIDQYRRMKKKGCSPNSRTFEILIRSFIVKDRVDEAVIVFDEMLDLGCQPDLSFYSCIIPLFCQENKLEEGIRLFEMMRTSNFTADSLVYEVLLQSLCKNLRLDDAIKVLEEMMETGLMPPNNVFAVVVYVFCKLGKVDDAMKFLEDKQIMETSACNVLLEGCCRTGKFLMAEDLLVKMSERNVADCNSWNIVIRWLSEHARIREVRELLGRMVVSCSLPDCDTYSALVVCHCKMSNYRNAVDIFDHICTKSWVLDHTSYSELVKGLCLGEMIHEATEVFCYMSRNRCSIEPSSFNMLIKDLCETGKVDEAIRIEQLACYSGTSSTSSTYSTIMLGLSKLDKVKDLLIVLSKMLVEGCSLDLDAYCVLIQSMSVQNRMKECLLLFNMMVDEGLIPDSERLFNLLSCIANHSQLHMISCSINKLTSDSKVLNSAIYNLLINGFWKEGYKCEACRFLDTMLEKGWVPDAKTHGLLIGSGVSEEVDRNRLDYDNSTVDTVSNILAEGLDATRWKLPSR
ncbi:pentatricopeptide repeat-containing protein At1g63330-like [Pyrus communis]|uniref:pentatricopeptide repeat-containing protein At1g63330-like n=1 Tax=Pyrus communis TaxID=23211 RepID=UPI0035BFBD53